MITVRPRARTARVDQDREKARVRTAYSNMELAHTGASDLGVLLEPGQVSAYLGIPVGTLANWRYQGIGPAFIRVGRHVRYRTEDVAAWVAVQLEEPTFPVRSGRRSRIRSGPQRGTHGGPAPRPA